MGAILAHHGLLLAGGTAATVTDDFSTNTIASYTKRHDASANWAISAGFLTASTGAQGTLTRTGVSWADGTISCVITEAADGGLTLREQVATTGNYYLATIKDSAAGTPNEIRIFKLISGTFTQLGSTGSISFTHGTSHTFSFTATGTSLIAKFDGATIVSTTDSAITAAGEFGARIGSAGSVKYDSLTWTT